MTRSAQRFTDSSDSRLRSENRATLRHATWTQRLNFPRRSEHFLQSYLHFHNRKIIRAQVHFQSHLSASITLQLEYTTEMHWRPQNTDTEKWPEFFSQAPPRFATIFTCQVVDCHGHWRYAECQARVQDLAARHGENCLVTTW